MFVIALGRKMSGQAMHARVLMDAELGVGLPCIDTELSSERDTLLRRAIRAKARKEQLAEEVRVLYVAMTRARERLILVGSVAGDKPPEKWKSAEISEMNTGLDMIAPALMQAGAGLTIREEAVRLGASSWRTFAHVGGAAGGLPRRTEETVLRLLAELAAAPKDEALSRLLNFKLDAKAAVRKTTVSAVLRDEKRATQEDEPLPDAPLMRLPRFMEEQQMTGAQIGTAFHRMMRMLDFDALRATHQLEAEIAVSAKGCWRTASSAKTSWPPSSHICSCGCLPRRWACVCSRHKSCTANGRLLTAARRRRARSSCRA